MLVSSQWQWNRKNACYLLQPTSLWAFDEVYEQSELNAVSSPSRSESVVLFYKTCSFPRLSSILKRLILIKDGEQYWGGEKINFHY